MTRAVIGLGANLGDRLATLGEAVDRMAALPDTLLVAVSRAYKTESWPSPAHPAYANAVAILQTSLTADELLAALQGIEHDLGRRRPDAERFGPRSIDLDIITFGEVTRHDPCLAVPHPRAAEREFVVVPWLEVDPKASWPDGSPVERSRAVHGRVTGVLGEIKPR